MCKYGNKKICFLKGALFISIVPLMSIADSLLKAYCHRQELQNEKAILSILVTLECLE